MPATVKPPPDSNVTLEASSSSHRYFDVFTPHIYLALGAVAIYITVRLAAPRLRCLQLACPWTSSHKPGTKHIRGPKDSVSLDSKRGPAVGSRVTEPAFALQDYPHLARGHQGAIFDFGSARRYPVLKAGLSPPVTRPGLVGRSWQPPAMDGDVSEGRKDHSGSAPATSRGVSTNTSSAADIRRQPNPSITGSGSGSGTERRRNSRSPRSPSQASSPRRHSGISNGADSQERIAEGKEKGKDIMASQGSWAYGAQDSASDGVYDPSQIDGGLAWAGSTRNVSFFDVDYPTQLNFSRPPPPPPLTPPTLSDAVFPFQDRRPSYAVSIPPGLDEGFIHRPNPDYMSSSTTSGDFRTSSPQSVSGIPRRRSYSKTVSVGIPIPSTTSASSSAETMTSSATTATFSPSSYPPRAPLLPPPPLSGEIPYEYEFVGGPGGPGIVDSFEEVDLHGEIISVMDEAGHGWKRHTRVYGGGVCLACIAAEGEGGFYGDKVPLEDRR
ncbi:hypothetical protein B0H66DRAFT_530777 [Apodospora peruviana]|uniref:Uncharacterized protein n=1 Tax=Apodospora peruviana TaxID=516989 RepID=A0AAE0IKE5_9PEZI|nr:hypothetical protein B0H66DRAFT_530777 [Apodospora peruviana]